ncbi:hypothetical protein CG716_22755 [Mycolicibacterium sphagni]|uniref:Oxidoreductase n=2 Tax=Mycolicibacterium sphagni TaxID=1786 RepID=A0A255DGT5_9MYCO|nr:hypothetical protein CG716_22755 [Mycolicibacterium sphagni]
MDLVVTKTEHETDEIRSLYLEPTDGAVLQPWSAGAHVHGELPSGLIRQYSLSNDPVNLTQYRISVLLEKSGRGGSAEIHKTVREGDTLWVGGPSNLFPLVEAPGYLFIAGGIGITPILPMIRMAQRARRDWRLVYGGRTLKSLAFIRELGEMVGGNIVYVPQDEQGFPDIHGEIMDISETWKIYACGPPGLLSATERECARAGRTESLRLERFVADPEAEHVSRMDDSAFEVKLHRSGTTISVPADRSILAAVREVRPEVQFDCQVGFCGTCETRVLDGVVDHRDKVLDEDERATNTTMMICVSRAKSARLVLDI